MQKVTQAYYSFMTQYLGISALRHAVSTCALIRHTWEEWNPHSPKIMYAPDGTALSISAIDHIVPVMCFMHLESILEDFLLQTLEALYFVNPQVVAKRKEGAVRYSEIFSAKSREELIERIVCEAVRATPRSLDGMISELRQFAVRLSSDDLALPFFAEMGATRNLWAHNGGRVDEEYLQQTRDYWAMVCEKPPSAGNQRVVTADYVEESMRRARTLVHEIEAHVAKHHPEICVREVEGLEAWSAEWHRPLPHLSEELTGVLLANGFEVAWANLEANSEVGFSAGGGVDAQIHLWVRLASEDLSDQTAIGDVLVRLTEQIERFEKEHQLPYELESVYVEFQGRKWIDGTQWPAYWAGLLTAHEFGIVRQGLLEGPDLLSALNFRYSYEIPLQENSTHQA